jgi:hypothetical protein
VDGSVAAACANFRIDQPVWCSLQRLTAKAVDTTVNCASIESSDAVVDGPGLQGRSLPSGRIFDLEQLVVGAGHELRRRWCAIGACGEVGYVVLDPGQRTCLGSKVRFTVWVSPVSWMNRFRLMGPSRRTPAPDDAPRDQTANA